MCANGKSPHTLHSTCVLLSVCVCTVAFFKAKETSSWKRRPLVISHIVLHESENVLVIHLLAMSSPQDLRRLSFISLCTLKLISKEGAIKTGNNRARTSFSKREYFGRSSLSPPKRTLEYSGGRLQFSGKV